MSEVSFESFLERAIKKHGNLYKYDKHNYVNMSTKMGIWCNKHEKYFPQKPTQHVRGQGCPDCFEERRNKAVLDKGKRNFLTRAIAAFPEYDYSETIYVDSRTEVKITCPIHGPFWRTPNQLYGSKRKKGCKDCGELRRLAQVVKVTKPQKQWIQEVRKVHGDKYDYSLVRYVNADSKVWIICPIHGPFEQKATSHREGYGCRACGNIKSKCEVSLIGFMRSYGYTILEEQKPKWLDKKHLDILVPELNLAIEYNGYNWHHSGSTPYSEYHDKRKVPTDYHKFKYDRCLANGINLIHIWDFEDLIKWKRKLDMYLKEPEKFQICFQNNKRTVFNGKRKYFCYGQSYIRRLNE